MIVGTMIAVVLVAALVWTVRGWRRAEAAARLPSPPRISGQETAVSQHLRDRYAAAERDPTSISGVGALCVAYHADMYFDHAERCYALASQLASEDWRWTYYRALIRSERGGGESLVTSLRQVVESAPRFGPAWLRLGEAEFKAGRYEAASDAWRRARELPEPEAAGSPTHVTEVPLSAYASLGLARLALASGDAQRAREILEEVNAAVPHFSSALRLLADSYRQLGREAEAARLLYRAGRLPPYVPYADPMVDVLTRESRNTTFLLRLASEANLSINAEWAEYLTRRALEFDANNPDVIVKLGRILRTLERNEEALEYFRRYSELVPGDYQGLAHIGACLSALGRYDEAEGFLRRALVGLDDPMTHYNLGLLLSRTGRLDGAITEYGRALDLDPVHSDARMNLATTLARLGRLDRASGELARLVEQDPENVAARTNLGLVLLQQGRTQQARDHLEEALRLDPQTSEASEALRILKLPER